jgi:hypothetical protein
MSDYLSNLASKALGLTEVVRPRSLHLFEAAPLEETTGIGDEGPATAPIRPAFESSEPARSRIPSKVSEQPLPAIDKPIPKSSPHIGEPRSRSLARAIARLPSRPKKVAANHRKARSANAIATVREPPRIARPIPSSLEAHRPHTPVSSLQPVQVGSGWEERARSKPEEPNRPPGIGRSRKSPPTVRVTIGRLEVKATQPALPPSTRKPPAYAPRLSLDAYLERRCGGAR